MVDISINNTKAEIFAAFEALLDSNKKLSEELAGQTPGIGNQPVKPISIVIPYVRNRAQENDLLYLIRSIELNLKAEHQIVVIGDREDFFSDYIIHIDHSPKSINKDMDFVHKIQAACESDLVTDRFVVSPAGAYFISPAMLSDIEILKVDAPRLDHILSQQAFNNTKEMLAGKGIVAENFACMLPFFVEKDRFVKLFIDFPELENLPINIETFYTALNYPGHSALKLDFSRDNVKLNLKSKNPNPALFKEAIANKKWLVALDSAEGEFLLNYLTVQFGEKCRLEKAE